MAKLTRRNIIKNRKSFNFFFKFLIFLFSIVFCFMLILLFNHDKSESLKKFKRDYYDDKVSKITLSTSMKNDLRLINEKTTSAASINNLQLKNQDIIDFEGFDNHDGQNKLIIPNIVHLVFYKTRQLSFYESINILSIYLNQNPDYIYMHCDEKCLFDGLYWNKINSIRGLKDKIVLIDYSVKNTIFGQKIKNKNELISAIKLLILMNYGGIVLDSNIYVVNSLNKYRKFEMVVSLEITPNERDRLSTQVLIAHKNARFLKAWFDSYRTRFSEISFYSSGTVAGRIFKSNPELVHVVRKNLGTTNMAYEVYKTYWPEWKNFDTLNSYLNLNYLDSTKSFINALQENYLNNKTNNCTFTYCEMCANVLEKIKQEL